MIAVLRSQRAAGLLPVVETLVDAGVRCIELTLTTAGVLAELRRFRQRFGDVAAVGLGTVTTVMECDTAVAHGVDFIVTPSTDLEVLGRAMDSGVPIVPGGLTPTELNAGWCNGAAAVKIFPAVTVGPSYLRHLRGPFPDMAFVPSGGIELTDVAGWMRAGATAVSLGSPLIQDAFDGGDLRALGGRARRALAEIASLDHR